jgi:regulator of replication initiation timing
LSNDDQSSLHDDLIENFKIVALENKKLKKYLTEATNKEKVAIESKDFNNELVLNNERLREEMKKFKLEKEHLANTSKMSSSWTKSWKTIRVVLDTIHLCKRNQQIKIRLSKIQIPLSVMSVEKKNTLLTIVKPHHQLPCQSTQDLLHLMLTMCSNED